MTEKLHKCPICGNLDLCTCGICEECTNKGYWLDSVGNLHHPEESDPASMYE